MKARYYAMYKHNLENEISLQLNQQKIEQPIYALSLPDPKESLEGEWATCFLVGNKALG